MPVSGCGRPCRPGRTRTPRTPESRVSASVSGWDRESEASRRCCAPRTPLQRGRVADQPVHHPDDDREHGLGAGFDGPGSPGPCLTPVSACATGNNAIGEAYLAIRDGRVDLAVAGGAEASIVPLAFSAFNSMRAMSTRNENPSVACAPFAVGRDASSWERGGRPGA